MRRPGRPVDVVSARIVDRSAIFASNSIDRSQNVRLGDLRRRTSDSKPAAGVDDEQAAVGVFQNIGRVKVATRTAQKVFDFGSERRAASSHLRSHDLVRIKLGDQEVVGKVCAQLRAAIASRPGNCDMPQIGDRWQEIAGSFELGNNLWLVETRVDTAVHPMHQAVASLPIEQIHRPEHFSFLGEIDLDRIVHSAAAMDLDVASSALHEKMRAAFPLLRMWPPSSRNSWPCRPSHQ